MSKPVWSPTLTDEQKKAGNRLCQCCGWRLTDGQRFCLTCLERARELPSSPRPAPMRVTDAMKRRGRLTDAQEKYIEGLLPVTCKRCGAGGHESKDCPLTADQAGSTIRAS